jgi:4a-hydroxytetrahydrobiopterin dehydratase
MSELATRRCKPCEGGIPPLSPTAAKRLLAEISSSWALTENAGALRREF